MKQKRIVWFVVLGAIICLLVSTQAAVGKTKTPVSGLYQMAFQEKAGRYWEADGNAHVRGDSYSFEQLADDPRFQGIWVNSFNAVFFTNNPTFDAKFWGKAVVYINEECTRTFPGLEDCSGPYWEASYSGKVVDGLQQFKAVFHGRGGEIDGLTAKTQVFQIPGTFMGSFEGFILEH